MVGSAYVSRLGGNLVETDSRQEEEEEGIAVKIAGRAVEREDEEDRDEEEYEEEDTDSHHDARRRSASPLVRQPKKSQREQVIEQIEAASHQDSDEDYELPSMDLLLESEEFCFEEHEKDVRGKAKVLEKTFADFGFEVRVVEIQTGPVIAQFEVELEAGGRLLVADIVLIGGAVVGLALFVVPGLIWMTLFTLVGPVIVQERHGLVDGFRRQVSLGNAEIERRLTEAPEAISDRDLVVMTGVAADKLSRYESWGRSDRVDPAEFGNRLAETLDRITTNGRVTVTLEPAKLGDDAIDVTPGSREA